MSNYLIYCDDFQEGIWFQSLDNRLANAKLEVIPSQREQIKRLALYNVLKYDRPDIILQDNNETIFVLERTVEVPSGHNVGQRYGRLLAAAEARIPAVYFGPYAAYKHGGDTSGPRYMNLRLFYALRKVSEIYNTAVTTINWPVDRQYEVLRTPEKDKRLKQYLQLFFDYYDRNGSDGLTEYIYYSNFQKQQYQEQENFAQKEIRNPEQYDIPPESLEIIPIAEFNRRYGLNVHFANQIRRVVLYHVGMTSIRSDPYTGMAALYTNLYGDENSVVILEFANIERARWDQQSRLSKTYRMFKVFSYGIVFSDGFVIQNDL